MAPTPQEQPPYSLRAFHLRLDFPREYPLLPPTVTFLTRIYHPNVDEQGRVCLPLLSSQNWKPHTKARQGESGRCGARDPSGRGQRWKGLGEAWRHTLSPSFQRPRQEDVDLQAGVGVGVGDSGRPGEEQAPGCRADAS